MRNAVCGRRLGSMGPTAAATALQRLSTPLPWTNLLLWLRSWQWLSLDCPNWTFCLFLHRCMPPQFHALLSWLWRCSCHRLSEHSMQSMDRTDYCSVLFSYRFGGRVFAACPSAAETPDIHCERHVCRQINLSFSVPFRPPSLPNCIRCTRRESFRTLCGRALRCPQPCRSAGERSLPRRNVRSLGREVSSLRGGRVADECGIIADSISHRKDFGVNK